MTIVTFAGLVSAATEWLARDQDATLIARIPDFITLCEAKLNRELRCIQMEERATALIDIEAGEPEFIALPPDFQTMRRVRLSSVVGRPRLEFMSGTQADEYRNLIGDVQNKPTHFTIFGDEMELIPTPDQAYTIEMIYRGLIPALNPGNTSNWLLSLAPDLYLYGTLLEATPYTKADERIQVWQIGFSTALNGLNQLSQDQAYGSGPLIVAVSGVTP